MSRQLFPQTHKLILNRKFFCLDGFNIKLWAAVFLLLAALSGNAQSNGSGNQPESLPTAEQARELAMEANAPSLATKQWKQAEKYWNKALTAREKGKSESANEAAQEATQLYYAAELQAIQNMLLFDARAAAARAEDNKAEKYAPRTLNAARNLIAQAERQLAADRYSTEEPTRLASQAVAMAAHAEQITAIARNKPRTEDLIIRWEAYLRRLQAAADMPMPVDTDPALAVDQLETEISRLSASEQQLVRDLADSQAFGAALEEEIRELDQRLGGASSERRQLVMQLEEQARAREQFAQAEAMFTPEEAIVFRQSDSLVVRLIGLRFASGSPNLSPGNEALLQKLEDVIALYPRSFLVVEGHTDSRGSDRINKRLSEQRAQTVASHIITEMRIPDHRLTVAGYGSTRPIANNETKQGREKNRRIDLLIKPENGMRF